ncbi:MAG: TetR/AcrR family transcriptional regulator [Candidatus Krumholzibacteriia bacterium]
MSSARNPGPVHHPESRAVPDALLDAAFRMFAERGYRAARLEDLAGAAGMTKGAVYYYFDSKEDLLHKAFRHRHREIFADITAAVDAMPGPASARIRFALRKVWQRWLESCWGAAFRLLLGEVSIEFPALFRTWAREGPIEGWHLVSRLVQHGIAAGEFRRDVDAEVAGRMIISSLMTQAALHVHLGLDELAPCDNDRIFDSTVDIFLHGLTVTHRSGFTRSAPSTDQ